jgi:hypothetical protein
MAQQWKGAGFVRPAKSVVKDYPFSTCFSVGCGPDFWVDGAQQGYGVWNNMSLQSVLPTWVWWPQDVDLADAAFIKISFDTRDAYEVASSLCFQSTPRADWLSWNTPEHCDRGSSNVDCIDALNAHNLEVSEANCKSVNCCWDKSDDPWCFHKTRQGDPMAGLPTRPNKKKLRAKYRMFKTQLDMSSGCTADIIYKITGPGYATLSLGYSLAGNVDSPAWIPVTSTSRTGGNWMVASLNIPAASAKMVVLWLGVELAFDFATAVRVGKLVLRNQQLPEVPRTPQRMRVTDQFVTTVTRRMAGTVTWENVPGADYYVIYANNKMVAPYCRGPGRAGSTRMATYRVSDLPEGAELTVRVSGGAVRAVRAAPSYDTYLGLTVGFSVLAAGGICATGGTWNLNTMRTPRNHALMIVFTITIPIILVVIFAVLLSKDNAITEVLSANPSVPGAAPKVAAWSGAKPQAFNACFDDAHVKCWMWLIGMWKHKNWPMKFTFFYNTLWIARDYYMLKDWIAMGHEISSHGHNHDCLCDTTDYQEQELVDNWIQCANLIRQLYGEPDKELMTATLVGVAHK